MNATLETTLLIAKIDSVSPEHHVRSDCATFFLVVESSQGREGISLTNPEAEDLRLYLGVDSYTSMEDNYVQVQYNGKRPIEIVYLNLNPNINIPLFC